MKMFECIIDDGKDVYKEVLTANNKKQLLDRWGGNGEFLIIKDVTKDYFDANSVDRLDGDLNCAGWSMAERRLIGELLREHIENRK